MRTTLNLDDELYRRVKKLAAERGQTVTAVVEEALRAMVSAEPSTEGYRFRLRPFRGRSVPSIDVADRRALGDVRERDRELYARVRR